MQTTRRRFLGQVATGSSLAAIAARAPARSANERLNIGVIGTAHRAAADLAAVAHENIVALCDIDEAYLGKAAAKFPKAKTYHDFRKLLEQRDLDAVVIGTADHTHAVATAAALRIGKHVYCEKPLTHTVHEARVIAKLAERARVATQMGIQIHAQENYRRVVELIQAGAIGTVTHVHVWCGGKDWFGGERPGDTHPVPKGFHWDLWLGPAPARPYHPAYAPKSWRRWWDFGNGTLGDMACHLMDLPFWALDLTSPTSIAAEGPPVHPETTPDGLIVRYEFPARGERPALALTWYDSDRRPPRLAELPKGSYGGQGILFEGEKGLLVADYGRRRLFPESDFRDYEPPPRTIARSVGHHQEWLDACKTGAPTTCPFRYGGALTEAVLLGNVAYRSGKKLHWNAAELQTGHPEAQAYLQREYRPGWTL